MDYYFTLGYIPYPYSIYKGINKLEPAHTITCQNGEIRKRQYWDLTYRVDYKKTENEYAEEFLACLKMSIKLHLMSEVPLGVFLSGGIDSSLLVALMSEMTSGKIKTFTMGFGGNIGGYKDERKLARQISERYQTDHTELVCEPNVTELLDTLADIFDEPFSDDSIIPTYHICKMASEKVTVALTGLGGDELFGGYERYLGLKFSRLFNGTVPYVLRKQLLIPIISKIKEQKNGDYKINHLKRFVRNSLLPEDIRYVGYISTLSAEAKSEFYTNNISDNLDSEFITNELSNHYKKIPGNDYLQKASYCDFHSYLPEDILAMSDRISMHHSMELRVPFVDHEIVEYCATIPSSLKIRGVQKKYLLRKIAGTYLPENIVKHRKQGFASPMTSWLKHDLKNVLKERLSQEEMSKHNFFNFNYVQKQIEDHMSGKEIHDKLLFSLLVFQTWYNKNH
jgi:asparagine synthase (glutamine-hydrolysing)